MDKNVYELENESESSIIKGKNREGIVLSPTEAEEYCEFKRQKRISEVYSAFSKSEVEGEDNSPSSLRKLCEMAKKINSLAIRIPLNYISQIRGFASKTGIIIDCKVGGDGETLTKVKAYEMKCALREGASEITLQLSPTALKTGKTGEICKEIRKASRVVKKKFLKVSAGENMTYPELLRFSRMVSENGGKYLSVPYFVGADKLRKDIGDNCMLEITNVKTAAEYKSLILAGVERIVTKSGDEIFTSLMREAENSSFVVNTEAIIKEDKSVSTKDPFIKDAEEKIEDDKATQLALKL